MPLFESVALILRFRMYHVSGKSKTVRLGSFIPSMTPAQRQARDALYSFIMLSTVETVDMDRLGTLFHNLADTLLRTTVPAAMKIAGPTDWTIFFAVLYADGTFHPGPAPLAVFCSKWQFVFRSIRLHIARLQLDHQTHYSHPPVKEKEKETVYEDIEPYLVAPDEGDDQNSGMPLLIHINDPEDELCEANQLAWEGVIRPQYDEVWDADLPGDANEAKGTSSGFTQPPDAVHADANQFDEPEATYIPEQVDIHDVKDDSDLL